MTNKNALGSASKWVMIVGLGLALCGCESVRQATGVAKLPPDEFTVLTKAPLIIPPDFNLRPPQPGIASRNEVEADDQGRALLFPQAAAAAANALGTAYSDSEKQILAKTNALAIDPNIRRSISADNGQEDQGPAFSQQVLFNGVNAAPPAMNAAPAAAALGATPAPAAVAPAQQRSVPWYRCTIKTCF